MRARPDRHKEKLLTALAFSLVAVLACAMPIHNDTWWHLKAGEMTFRGLSPFIDHFSWTADGQFFWNHSWLSQVIMFAMLYLGGPPLTTALSAVVVVATWWLVWRECRGDAVERIVLLAVAISVSTVTWSVRPQVAIALLPVALKLTAEGRSVPLAFVMALWANLHAGFAVAATVFVAGIAAAAIFDRTMLRRRTIAALFGGLATLVTPLGLENWRQVVLSVGRSRANAIIEWQPPAFGGEMLFFWGTAGALLVLLAARWRRLDAPYVQVSAVAAVLAFLSATQAVRNVPAFMMLALPPLSAMLFKRRETLAVAWWWAMPAPVVAAAWLWTHPPKAMDWTPIADQAARAVTACRAPIFNTYSQGGPLIWFAPSQKVFVDSRQDPYPVSLIQEAVAVEQRGEYRESFDRRGINCAVLPPTSPAVAPLRDDGWRVTYADDRWAVLERPSDHSASGVK
jgi:hypothetical protein